MIQKICAALAVFFGAWAQAQPPRYEMRVLETIPRPGERWAGHGFGINEAGVVVGSQTLASDTRVHTPAMWVNGVIQLLPPVPGYDSASATAISENGIVLGVATNRTPSGSSDYAAWRWDGERVDVYAIPGHSISAIGFDGDGGMVVNIVDDFGMRAATWENGAPRYLDLPTYAYNSVASATSRGGLIGGGVWYGFGENFRTPTVWSPDGTSVALAVPGWASAGGGVAAVNDCGSAVGAAWSTHGFVQHALLWRDGQMIDLFPESEVTYAQGINNFGQIVGTAVDDGAFIPLLWHDDVRYELAAFVNNPSDGQLITADQITDSGFIVGTAIVDGYQVGVVLTPVPAPAGLVVIGLALMLAARRRRG